MSSASSFTISTKSRDRQDSLAGPEFPHLDSRNEMAAKMSPVGAFLKIKAGFTGLSPVVNSVVAERLAAEKVVTLQVTAHCLQEAKYKRGAGGCR